MGDKYAKYKQGRPTELGYEIIEKVYRALCAGMFVEQTAALVGVSKTTFYMWLQKGAKAPDSIYGHLVNAVERGNVEYEMRELLNLDKAAMGSETEYLRYEEGTFIEDIHGKRIDVSGQIVITKNGNPVITKMGNGRSASVSQWRLERKFRDRWGSVQTIKNDSNAPQVIVTIPSNGREVQEPELDNERTDLIDVNDNLDPKPIEKIDEPEFELDLPDNGTKED